MSEKCGFFNSKIVEGNYDREYMADDFASYFAKFIGNGLFPNPSTNCQMTEGGSLTVIAKAGSGFICGYYYENTADLALTLDHADGILSRIDKVVLRLDLVERGVCIKIKKGEFASQPQAPVLQRDSDIYELALADIYVAAGTTSVTQADITDLRLSKNLCGTVHGVIEQVDTTTIFNQFSSWYQLFTSNSQSIYQSWTGERQEEFDIWYLAARERLDETVGQQLWNEIGRMDHVTQVTLPAVGWGTSAPYSQRVAVPGLKVTDSPHLLLYAPKTLSAAETKNRIKYTAMVTDGEPEDGYMTFYCGVKKPDGDFVVQLEGVSVDG